MKQIMVEKGSKRYRRQTKQTSVRNIRMGENKIGISKMDSRNHHHFVSFMKKK